jgi:hypothetical protein
MTVHPSASAFITKVGEPEQKVGSGSLNWSKMTFVTACKFSIILVLVFATEW